VTERNHPINHPSGSTADLARMAMPPSSRLLGFELRESDAEAGRVVIGFDGKADFCNPLGSIQGGFLAAMLDEAMAVAAWVKTGFTKIVPTLEMKVTFIAPAYPGPLVGEGKVIYIGKTIAFLEGSLRDGEGKLLTMASATARLVPAPWSK
jgi:uncharacterized protein (TIGR00369 family)